MAGIPSVVWGLWGLTQLVPLILKIQAPGTSLLAGALVLAGMIIPTIALTVMAHVRALPPQHGQAAAALGMSPVAYVVGIVLPNVRSGIAVGSLLAMTRALGETMVVLMVCGNVVQIPESIFAPIRTLTATIALEMAYAQEQHAGALYVAGGLLLVIVTALVLVARHISREETHA
jgi:phosphate transport system permease protein